MQELDALISRLADMPEPKFKEIETRAKDFTKGKIFLPNMGPQTQAYFSKADVLLYGGAAGGGKLLALDTPIPTPFGWTTMGDIRVGDTVFGADGKHCHVIAKSGIETENTYRLIFSDGAEIVAGARHQWVTSTQSERTRKYKGSHEWRAKRRASREKRGTGKRPDLAIKNAANPRILNLPLCGVRTTQEIAETLLTKNRINHSVQVAAALDLPEIDLPIDPYLLGAWLGDGTTANASITIAEPEMVLAIGSAMPQGWTLKKRASKYCYGMKGGMQVALRILGVLGNKHIPVSYLRSSQSQRVALLQGLMDTDGYCDSRGQCEITLVRCELIKGVSELLSSLGIKNEICEGVATLDGRVVGPKYRIKFITDLPVFRLSRKLLRQKRHGFRGTHNNRYIVAAELINPVPMQCIEVDNTSHMYLCGRQMIPTHNSSLGIGLALNEHNRSLIIRRTFAELDGLLDTTQKLVGSSVGLVRGNRPKYNKSNGGVIHYAGMPTDGGIGSHQGVDHDFIYVDEAATLPEFQIRLLFGWLRTETGIRCRIILGSNPPLDTTGDWMIKYFAPWLDPRYPKPARQGELRYFIVDGEGEDIEVTGPVPRMIHGVMVTPQSRTFIQARVSDNPYYANTDYETKTLAALSGPMRAALRDGNFLYARSDADWQVIPTEWVKLAQERWRQSRRPENVPMCAIGVDPSRGGKDRMVLAPRYDGWFEPLICVAGEQVPDGPTAAGIVIKHRRDAAPVVIDSVGIGSSPLDQLKLNDINVIAYNGGSGSSARTADKTLKFYNKRAESYWRFREALDPSQLGGSPIMLPDDQELMTELCSVCIRNPRLMQAQGILLESKDDIKKRISRSPDKADAVVLAWAYGDTISNIKDGWGNHRRNKRPEVIVGHQNKKRKYK